MTHVLITGGNSGIGDALTKKFLERGYDVSITYKSKFPIDFESNDSVKILKVDLESAHDVSNLIDFISRSPIDVFVNNAAVSIKTPFLKISEAELRKVIEVNLISIFQITQKIFDSMVVRQGGRIINVGSIGGQVGGRDQIHYAVSKGALETLIKSIARIGFEHDIFTFNLSPGLVDTPMLRGLHKDISNLEKNIPFGAIVKPEDVAKTICDLCGTNWNYASGQTINYNGGLLL